MCNIKDMFKKNVMVEGYFNLKSLMNNLQNTQKLK